MKEPLTPRPPNSRKQCHIDDPEPQISAPDPKELHTKAPPETCPPTDATLRNMTLTWTNYAARTNLASPNPANEEGPTALATSAGIRARPWEDPHYPPANRTAKTTKAPNLLGAMKDLKAHPPIPIWRTSPPQTKENPYTPSRNFRESNSITPPEMPRNPTGELPPPPPDLGSPPCNAPPRPDKPRD
ncbi:hypothetical protein J132_02231 [Termitomyces sp. J132]|nr:hypothetical protein J132_02231 [Termitomyces sp. J132]